ncbi:MAG: carboxypeptidase-like regulatory domain-containing protein [Muribaculaceae bacterium]|nr:carboxypeptidase-like regulatory domain-containing protein [Muribaculaceae bacterium]
MMRQILLYVFILFVGSISAEQFKITGKVVDEFYEPLIGTTVEIKGTDRRTAADIDGNFSIEVEKGAILKFSYVGYISKEVEVLNDSSLVVELEEDEKFPLRDDYMIGVGPTRREYNYKFTPIERDSTKTNPKNQNSVINH